MYQIQIQIMFNVYRRTHLYADGKCPTVIHGNFKTLQY